MANSFVKYTADGATQTFTITFPYINTDHIEAYVDGVEDTTFTLPTSSTLTLTAMPDNGAIVKIKRVTPRTTRLVDFEAGNTVSEDNLDTDSEQNFYAMQEVLDDQASLIVLDEDDDEYDADTKQIKNVVDPTEAQHAATKNYIDVTFVSDLAAAVASATASAAAAASDAVDTAADLVLTNADVVSTNADVVLTNADVVLTGLDVDATNADVVSTNADAASTAQDAIDTAADLVQTALDAIDTAADVVLCDASEAMAEEWAEKAEDSAITDNPGQYSALHHAAKAAASAASVAARTYFHTENPAAATWTVNHNLGYKYCIVEVMVSDVSVNGTYDQPVITFVTTNQLTIEFDAATAGNATIIGGNV